MTTPRVCVLTLGAFLSACASGASQTPSDRELFRLQVASVAEGATPDPTRAPASDARGTSAAADAPAATARPRLAYTTSIRLVRPDGTTLTAPRLTAYAGQRANIQILNQTAYIQDFDVESQAGAFIVDPVIGMLHEGALLDLVVVPVVGRADEAAVGLRLRTVAARKPIGTREFQIAGTEGTSPVTIQTPRTEEVEVAGAQRVRLGAESEWARVPDPDGGPDLRIVGRIDLADVSTLDDPEEEARLAAQVEEALLGEPARRAKAEPSAEPASMRPLADAAADRTAPTGMLHLTAVRMPRTVAGGVDLESEPYGTWSLRTVARPGVRIANTLSEAHLSDWVSASPGASETAPLDPLVAVAVSGVQADIGADGTLRVRWTTVSRFDTFTSPRPQGVPMTLDLPTAVTAECTFPLTPGRTVHRMFVLPDVGEASIVVVWTPDQAP